MSGRLEESAHAGQAAFEERFGPPRISAVDHVLLRKAAARVAPSDSVLLKVAQQISPDDIFGFYEMMGGGYDELSFLAKEAKGPSGLRTGVVPFGHQDDAVTKFVDKGGSLLFSHPVGSGKTLTSISAFETLRDQGKATRALVVVPASLRTNYLDSGVKKFTNAKGAVFGNAAEIAAGTHVSLEKPDPSARYHIVSYDMFRKNPKKYIEAAGADTVIYDELHKAKNEGVLTTKAIKEARPFHKNFIGMTGSIVSNTPADIVPLIDAMTNGQHVLGNKTTFEARFVKTNDDGSKELRNPQVIRTLLGPYVHHLDPKDIHTGAPKKMIEEVRVEMSPHQAQLYRYVTNQLDPLTKLKMQMGASKLNGAEMGSLFSKIIRLRQLSNSLHTVDTKISVEDSSKATPKVQKLLDDVQEHLRETHDGQVVIHTNLIQGGVDVLQAGLKARGIDHALFIGKGNEGVTEESRQHGVKEYQQGKKRVIVLSAAGGEGLDLPNTTFMAMLDGHFNPEKINQAEARGVRAGGQAHRAPDQRKVIVRRYLTVLPDDVGRKVEIAKNLLSNINPKAITARLSAGGTAFFNPLKKQDSSDEWIYNVAKGKAGLNNAFYDTVKMSSEKLAYVHDDFEDFEKMAGPLDSAKRVHDALLKHPELVGGIAGGLWGGLMSGTPPRTKAQAEADPGAPLRNRVSGALGGALGGALSGHLYARGSKGPAGLSFTVGPAAGRNIADLAAPATRVPTSVVDLLGKGKTTYSDKQIFEDYWQRHGNTLEQGGVDAKIDPAEEQKHINALRDLYVHSKTPGNVKANDGVSKKNYLIGNAIGMTMAPIVSGYGELLGRAMAGEKNPFGPGSARNVALGSLPLLLSTGAGAAKGYRERFIDPGITVSNRGEAKTRARFDDDQLRKLLRGLAVEEVKTKQHVIK